MLSKEIEGLLNGQIRNELFSSYLYLSMSAYLSSVNLNGYAHWFRVQAMEERDHALIIYNYIIKAGGRVLLLAIDEPKADYTGVEEVLKDTLDHEKFITSTIYRIVDAATQEKDFKTVRTMDWFVNEQVEEEDNANNNVGKFKAMGVDGKGLYLLDQEMAARVYVPAAILAQA